MTVLNAVSGGVSGVFLDDSAVVVRDLRLTDRDLFAYVTAAADPAEAVARCAAFGARALSFAESSLDAEIMERQVERLNGEMQACTDELMDTVRTAIHAYVDPDVGPVAVAMRDATSTLDNRIATTFDPGRSNGVLAQFAHRLTEVNEQHLRELEERLSPRGDGPLAQLQASIQQQFTTQLQAIGELAVRVGHQQGEASARANSSHKGADFEARVECSLARVAETFMDEVEATGTTTGSQPGSKKGDVVVTVNPRLTAGRQVRILIEAKNRNVKLKRGAIELQLAEAMANHGCTTGLAVFSSLKGAPNPVLFSRISDDKAFVVLDGSPLDEYTLQLGFSWVRVIALTSLTAPGDSADLTAVADAVHRGYSALQRVRTVHRHVGSIINSAEALRREADLIVSEVTEALDRIRTQMGAPN